MGVSQLMTVQPLVNSNSVSYRLSFSVIANQKACKTVINQWHPAR